MLSHFKQKLWPRNPLTLWFPGPVARGPFSVIHPSLFLCPLSANHRSVCPDELNVRKEENCMASYVTVLTTNSHLLVLRMLTWEFLSPLCKKDIMQTNYELCQTRWRRAFDCSSHPLRETVRSPFLSLFNSCFEISQAGNKINSAHLHRKA